MRLLLFLLIFLATLRSYYFYGLGTSIDNLALFVAFIVAVVLRIGTRPLPKEALLLSFVVLIALFGGFAITLFTSAPLKLATPAAIAVFLVCGLIATKLMERTEWRFGVEQAIRATLLIHAVFLMTQLLVTYVLGVHLDFLVVVTGEESRNFGGSGYNFGLGSMYRPSGLTNEPGTYAAYILPLIALQLTIRRYRVDRVILLSLLSVLATFSSQGIAGAILIIMVVLYNNRGPYTAIALPIFGIVGFLTASVAIWERIFLKDEYQDLSVTNRIDSTQQAFSQMLGNGFIEPTIGIADSTTIVYWWWYCGLFAVPLLLFFAWLGLKYFRFLGLLFLILFTSKVPAAAPMYWLLIGLGVGMALAVKKQTKVRSDFTGVPIRSVLS